MNCAGKLNFLILEVNPLGSCDKNDSLKAFELAETVVVVVVVVVKSVGNQKKIQQLS
jgi:hypothetical protein